MNNRSPGLSCPRVKAKEVHAILRAALKEGCRAHGFTRFPRRSGMWYREGTDRMHVWRISLDVHFGHIAPLGGRMFLRAWCAKTLPPAQDESSILLRELLPDAALRRMKDVTDAVTAKILAGNFLSMPPKADLGRRAMFERFQDELTTSLRTPYDAGMRLDEMCYLDEADIQNWGAFLVDALPHIVTALAARDRAAESVADSATLGPRTPSSR